MRKFTIKVLAWLALVLTVISVAIEIISEHVFHADALKLMGFLPVAFFLAGIGMLVILYITDKKDDNRLLQNFMLIKMLKNFVIVIMGLFYELVVDVNFKVFLLTAGFYYLTYLIFETIVLFQFEKLLKKLK